MSKIYTKTGDSGKTSLFDGTRVSKSNDRVDTYGSIDELNSQIGVVVSQMGNKDYEQRLIDDLLSIQDDLLHIGSLLADPGSSISKSLESHLKNQVSYFEKRIDEMTKEMPELTNFIIPGGGKIGAFLQMTRTIARRVERRIISLLEKSKVDNVIVMYFNRLSDLLFTMSRYVNYQENEKEKVWNKSF